jgi:hypothetical protein
MLVGTSSSCEPAVWARNAGWILTPGKTSISPWTITALPASTLP